MKLLFLGLICLLSISMMIYIEFSPSSRECRAKGGVPYLEGCYKTTVEKIEL
jgi:hypothetical protein